MIPTFGGFKISLRNLNDNMTYLRYANMTTSVVMLAISIVITLNRNYNNTIITNPHSGKSYKLTFNFRR